LAASVRGSSNSAETTIEVERRLHATRDAWQHNACLLNTPAEWDTVPFRVDPDEPGAVGERGDWAAEAASGAARRGLFGSARQAYPILPTERSRHIYPQWDGVRHGSATESQVREGEAPAEPGLATPNGGSPGGSPSQVLPYRITLPNRAGTGLTFFLHRVRSVMPCADVCRPFRAGRSQHGRRRVERAAATVGWPHSASASGRGRGGRLLPAELDPVVLGVYEDAIAVLEVSSE
jgi:hypothetical protein